MMTINSMLSFVSILTILIAIHLFRKQQKEFAISAAVNTKAPQHYSIMIKSFKTDGSSLSLEQQVKNKINKIMQGIPVD